MPSILDGCDPMQVMHRTEEKQVEIGFCGPGLMGAPIIRHLLSAGHSVQVWNRTRAKAEALVPDGATVASTPAELAGRAEAIFLCVLDAAAVEEVVFGANGIVKGVARASGDSPVRWIVDHGSIPPSATRAFAQ